MTKYVSPEIAGTELTGTTDYIRLDDGATMRWDGIGSFVAIPGSFEADKKLVRSKRKHRPVIMGNMVSPEDTKESSEKVSLKWAWREREKHFDKEQSEEEAERDSEKDTFEETGKRRVGKKPLCNRSASTAPWRNIHITKTFNDDFANEPCSHFRFRNFVIPSAVNRFRCTVAWTPEGRFRDIVKSDWLWLFWQVWRFVDRAPFLTDIGGNTVPDGLCDTTQETLRNRAKIQRYDIEFPEQENPDSSIFPRKPRNASPSRDKDESRLNAWAEYRRLNESLEPLQTIYGKADGDNYEYPSDADTEGGERPEAKYPLDSTLENRPSVEEMEARWSTVEYETRIVCCGGEPRLSEDGYMATPIRCEMKIPVSGSVECIGFRKNTIDLKPAAIESMGAYARRQAASRRLHWPVAKYAYDKKQIGIVVDRMETKPELLNIKDVDMSKTYSIRRIGGLHFDQSGKLTHYRDKNGIKHWVKVDVPRNARGPAFLGSANQKDAKDMAKKGWEPRHAAMRLTRMVPLSGEQKAENWANEEVAKKWSRAGLRIQLRVPLKDESKLCRDLYHRSRRGPTRSSPMPRRWLPAPYDTPVKRPRADYAFGKTYTLPDEPADNVVERGSTLDAVNAMLSPQGLRVANAVVHTELTIELADTREDVGAMLRDGSMDTLRLRGNKAIDDTADELILIFQRLASV